MKERENSLNKRILELEKDNVRLKNQVDEIIGNCSEDITGRKLAELELKVSDEKFPIILNRLHDAVFVYELNEDGTPGKFIEVNNFACERLEYSYEELLNLSIYDINKFDETVDPKKNNELNENRSVIVEASYITKSGKIIPVEVNVHRVNRDEKRMNQKD